MGIGISRRRTAIVITNRRITPSIISVRDPLGSGVVICCHYVSLQVLLEPISVKLTFAIRGVSILHTNRTSISIAEIKNKVIAPLLCHDQRVAEVIDVLNPIDCFASSNSFVVVFEGEVEETF